MTTPLRLDYAVNDAEVIAAFKRQQAELEKERKAREGLQKQITDNSNAQRAADKAASESAKAHSAAVKEATQIAEKYATKEERVAAELKRLNELKSQGVLKSKDYARAVAAENAKLSETGNAADKSGGLIGGLTSKMGGFVAGLASVATVVSFLKAEYDGLIDRQGKSRDANLDLAGAQSAALDNLDTTMSPAEFAERMRAVSKDLGMSEKDLTVAASSALSAKGDKTAAEAIGAVTASAKLNRFAPDQLPAMAGSALDLGKHLGMNPEEALGFLLGTQRTSRTVSLKGVTENIAPGIIGGVNMGLSKENAAAVAASLSGTSVDPNGSQTGTTMSALFMQLREFGKDKSFMGGPELAKQIEVMTEQQSLEKQSLKERFDKASIALAQKKMPAGEKAETRRQLEAEEKRASAALKSRQEAQLIALEDNAPELGAQDVLRKLQADPALRSQFLKGKSFGGFGATFERKMQTSVEQLLTPGTQGFRDYQNALRTQQTLNPQQMFDETVKAKDAMPAIRLAKMDQGLGNVGNQLHLGDTEGAESAILRTRLGELRAGMGNGVLKTKMQTVIDDIGSGGTQTTAGAIDTISSDAADLRTRMRNRTRVGKATGDETLSTRPGALKSQAEDARALKVLEDMLAVLKRAAELQAQNNNQVAARGHAGIVANRRVNHMEGGP